MLSVLLVLPVSVMSVLPVLSVLSHPLGPSGCQAETGEKPGDGRQAAQHLAPPQIGLYPGKGRLCEGGAAKAEINGAARRRSVTYLAHVQTLQTLETFPNFSFPRM